ncbi:lysoplasmalogenase [Thalassotalea sediminis]|uniref:lysoplasmalogenase n=1 Tax=Thalassotalea sediminis TaxID=1759089 RepID=UPI00257409C0|nr:lysoplasmalogenase [Thalassotalea sediminis]
MTKASYLLVHKLHFKAAVFLYSALAALYLVSLFAAPYSLQFSVKVLPIIVLVIIARRTLDGNTKHLMSAALFFSGIGDTFLAPSHFYHFTIGLAAFLLAQLIYCYLFFKQFAWHNNKQSSSLISITLVIYACAMAGFIVPKTGELMIPVIVYLVIIMLMGVSAILSSLHWLVKVGAIVFIASDSILAIGLFSITLPAYDLWVMATYYIAQFCILVGMVKSREKTDN